MNERNYIRHLETMKHNNNDKNNKITKTLKLKVENIEIHFNS